MVTKEEPATEQPITDRPATEGPAKEAPSTERPGGEDPAKAHSPSLEPPPKEVPGEYIVTAAPGSQERTLADVLTDYASIRVLDRDGEGALLILSEPTVIERLTRDHPELMIEPNILYEKLPRPR